MGISPGRGLRTESGLRRSLIFLAGLRESNRVAESGQGFAYYLGLVPYLFYPCVALALVILVALGRPLGEHRDRPPLAPRQPDPAGTALMG